MFNIHHIIQQVIQNIQTTSFKMSTTRQQIDVADTPTNSSPITPDVAIAFIRSLMEIEPAMLENEDSGLSSSQSWIWYTNKLM
jgi:hypothetical protein